MEDEAHDRGAVGDERPISDDDRGSRNSRLWAYGPAVAAVAAVAIVIAVVQLPPPPSVAVGPLWLIPAVELIGIPLGIAIWTQARRRRSWLTDRWTNRWMAAYPCFLASASALNAVLLLTTLLSGSQDSAAYLLFAGFGAPAVSVLTFGLIYLRIDGGGPKLRAAGAAPLAHRVTLLFTLQSSISLVTILVTVSRATNLIPGNQAGATHASVGGTTTSSRLIGRPFLVEPGLLALRRRVEACQ